MPFVTDAAWPDFVLEYIDSCHEDEAWEPYHRSLADRYCVVYPDMLRYCFNGPVGDPGPGFLVGFQGLLSGPWASDTKYVMPSVVRQRPHFRPVLIFDIQDPAWATRAHLRLEADRRMHQRYDYASQHRYDHTSNLNDCPLPHLWGLSLLGTSLRVYCGDVATGVIEPVSEDPPSPLPPDFLEGAWDIDILSQEGFWKMKEIVGDIVCLSAELDPRAHFLPISWTWKAGMLISFLRSSLGI
ncbi:hypothetical protein DFP72DRAFT_1011162 [Ephemerocybe angulata]|uniref:Uncharacterized protein n=1 Tax=Ephemerocybe angulata TaxID=980116 RepID=A0A8H6HTW0_9AGAR|nr:hypothetical protein DFP72DRAFT_1011162 [Tulosesus angulatus]